MASEQAKRDALGALRAEGVFSVEAGGALLAFLDHEPRPGLRAEAAHVFYLLFYGISRAGPAATDFLLSPEVLARVSRILLSDPQSEVRVSMAQLGQIMLFGLDSATAESLARAYIPALIDGLADADPDVRNEVRVALENARQTAFFKSPEARRSLETRREQAADPDLKEAIGDLLRP